jgi:hypothetical protein
VRALQEGFLRVRTYRLGSSLHTAWWKECQRLDRAYIVLVERPSCSRVIVDTYTRKDELYMAPRFVDEIVDWARTAHIGGHRSDKAMIGDAAMNIDGLDPEEAERMAEELARCLHCYPSNWVGLELRNPKELVSFANEKTEGGRL